MTQRRFAALIGNNRYPQDSGLDELRCPENDARDFQEILAAKGYGAFDKAVPLVNLKSYDVLLELDGILKSVSRDDLVLIYYSGHGKPDVDGYLHLATADTVVDSLTVTSVPVERIRSLIRSARASRVILILDCCYSGAAINDFLRKGGSWHDQLQRVSQAKGTYILTASTESQVAKEKQGDSNSLLTKHILEGIRTGGADIDADGLISMDDLYDYVYARMEGEDTQEPMRWDLDVRGQSLVIAGAGLEQDQWRRAIEEGVSLGRSSGRYQSNLYNRGVNYIEAGLWRKGLESLSDLIKIVADYKDAAELISYAKTRIAERVGGLSHAVPLAIENEDWGGALGSINEILALDPDNEWAKAALAKAQIGQSVSDLYAHGLNSHAKGDLKAALGFFMRVNELKPDYKDVGTLISRLRYELREAQISELMQGVMKARDAKNWDAVEEQYRKIVELDPGNVGYHLSLFEFLNDSHQIQKAERELTAIVRLDPKNPQWHGRLGLSLRSRGELAMAEGAFKAAAELEPDNARWHAFTADVLMSRGLLNEAEAEYQRVIDLEPDYPSGYWNLAQILCKEEKWDAAEEVFRELLKFDHDSIDARADLAKALLEQGKLAEAEAEYRLLVQRLPKSPQVHASLAHVLHLQKRWAEAVQEYKIASTLPYAQNYKSKIAQARSQELPQPTARPRPQVGREYLEMQERFERAAENLKRRIKVADKAPGDPA